MEAHCFSDRIFGKILLPLEVLQNISLDLMLIIRKVHNLSFFHKQATMRYIIHEQ